jgi:hypothetical protein
MKATKRVIVITAVSTAVALATVALANKARAASVDDYHACQSQARVGAVAADANRRHMSRDRARAAVLLAIRESDEDRDTQAGMRALTSRVIQTVYAQGIRDTAAGKRLALNACLDMADGM